MFLRMDVLEILSSLLGRLLFTHIYCLAIVTESYANKTSVFWYILFLFCPRHSIYKVHPFRLFGYHLYSVWILNHVYRRGECDGRINTMRCIAGLGLNLTSLHSSYALSLSNSLLSPLNRTTCWRRVVRVLLCVSRKGILTTSFCRISYTATSPPATAKYREVGSQSQLIDEYTLGVSIAVGEINRDQ